MPWLQAHLIGKKEQAPLIELLFENLGAVSVTMADAADEPMLEPAPGETPLWSNTRVSALFEASTNPDNLRSAINQALNTETGNRLTLEILQDQAWERAWLDHFHAMQFGEHLWICPTGSEVDAEDSVVVHLDPGLAFGTGTHPTTALCLQWLDQADVAGKTVVDFGCGSGILAIAALKLGARKVIATDHDPQAIQACLENARLNQVDDRLQAVHSSQFEPVEADIVLANILANVLIELAPQIVPLLKPSADLVLSGILEEQADAVITAYASEVEFQQPVIQEGWCRLDGHHR
jgi:ribosomal protein L11 methyltransferase